MSIKYQRGVNLIEILVTIAITTVGLLGISSLQMQSNRATQDSGNKSQAIWIIEDLANRMGANSKALEFYATNGNYSCPVSAPTRCADYNDGSSQKTVTACTAENVARFDLWDAVCTQNHSANSIAIRKSAADFISNPVLNITVNDTNISAVISLTWDVRTSGSDQAGNTVYLNNDSVTNQTATLRREVRL